MRNIKLLIRKYGFLSLILLIVVIVGGVFGRKFYTEDKKVEEEIWKPSVEMKSSEIITTEDTNLETSTDSTYWVIPQAEDCFILDEEKQQLQNKALSAAESVSEIYKDIEIVDISSYSSGITEFTREQRKAVVKKLGENGFVSVEEDTNMQNYEAIETFYTEYLNGQDSMVTIFKVHRDGYFRVKPLSDDCRELTKKYISGLSYVNYNMLVTNWDSSNVEDILMPCMYEDIYRIHTGENLRTENQEIPAEQYENIMTTYFPVSIEQLRKHCGYIEDSASYPYEMIYASPYPPFGEVIDYTENANGTITLMVDGVWSDYNSDCAFTNQIVVQPFEDGTFKYLSNSIEQKELELPPIVRTKR